MRGYAFARSVAVSSSMRPVVGGCMIIIFIGAMAACGRNGDHRARRVAEAVMAHGAKHKPADAYMFLRADYEQRRSDRFGQQDWPRLAGEKLQSPAGFWLDGIEYGRDRFVIGGIH